MKGDNADPFRILSLDGGGIRGAFVASFLKGIEDKLGHSIAEHFDLIAGTSTGGIIAAALAVREPASRIDEFYRARGPVIFQRRRPLLGTMCTGAVNWVCKRFGLDFDHLMQSKYDGKELKVALKDVFGGKTIEDAQSRLLIPSIDLTRGQTVVFKTPHLPNMYRDRRYEIVDVLLAATSAPTYFPHAVITDGSAFVDGGLWANNPSMVAFAEALKIRSDANRSDKDYPISLERIELLSVGTGKASYFAMPSTSGAGLVWWGRKIIDVSSIAQSQGVSFQSQYVLGSQYFRVDYDLPDGSWNLDSVAMLDRMRHIGAVKADEYFATLRDSFLKSRGHHPYAPFTDASHEQASLT